jgi:flagellar hook-associated protein 3 FlgL
MRVTNKMLSNNFLRDMNSNLENMQKLQNQLATGNVIAKASDDPYIATRSMQMYTTQASNDQYKTNISDVDNYLDVTDTALDKFGNAVQRIRELVNSSGSVAYGTTERQAIVKEVTGLKSQMSEILNTSFDGKYVFSGYNLNDKPMKVDTLEYSDGTGTNGGNISTAADIANKNKEKLQTEISQGVTIKYNVNATEVLNFKDSSGNTIDVNNLIDKVVTDLNTQGVDCTLNLDEISSVMDNVLKIRGTVGANQNRMETAKSRNEDETLNLKEILTKTSNIDYAETTMEYASMQQVYLASLQTSAKVIQPSLMDYL